MPNSVIYQNCPCCNSDALHFIMLCEDYVVTREKFELWQCENCSFRFIQNAPPDYKIGRYYDSEKYRSHSIDDTGFFNKIFQLARKYSVWWRYQTVTNAVKNRKGNLLDIGSGVGAFADVMAKKNWNVTALEPDETARKNALNQYGIETLPMETLYDLKGETFDVITLWHVLEHVHDINGYLQQISRLLKNDGLLVIAVPNFFSTDAGYYKQYWDAYDVPRHLFHFSPTSLNRLIEKHGFKIIKLKMFWLDAYFACLLSEEHKHGKKKWISAAWHGLLSNFTALFNKKKSSAITYILKKVN